METIALNPFCVEAPRNRQQLGDPRHGVVKRRVEAGHLGQFRAPLAERLDQFNLAGQMIRVVRPKAMRFSQQFPGDHLGLDVFHAVDHSVSHSQDRSETILLFELINQEIRCRLVIGSGNAASVLLIPGRVVERQIRSAQADAVNLSMQLSLQRLAGLIQHELDA